MAFAPLGLLLGAFWTPQIAQKIARPHIIAEKKTDYRKKNALVFILGSSWASKADLDSILSLRRVHFEALRDVFEAYVDPVRMHFGALWRVFCKILAKSWQNPRSHSEQPKRTHFFLRCGGLAPAS